MSFTISKRFDFSASHQLEGLPEHHQCSRLHGHNYSVFIILIGEINKTGFVKDYGELDNVKIWLNENVEHKHLNEVFTFNPTAELIAQYLFNIFKNEYPQLKSVTVKETDKTSATYEP